MTQRKYSKFHLIKLKSKSDEVGSFSMKENTVKITA